MIPVLFSSATATVWAVVVALLWRQLNYEAPTPEVSPVGTCIKLASLPPSRQNTHSSSAHFSTLIPMSSYPSTGADTTTVNLVQTGGFRISNNNTYHPGSRHESPVYVMQSGFYHFASPEAVRQPPNGNRPPAVPRNVNAHTLDGHFAGQRIYSISMDILLFIFTSFL